MKERPIIFNAEMVKAILAGSKTQTRRIMKNQPKPSKTREGDYWFSCNKMQSMVHVSEFIPGNSVIPDGHEFVSACCPHGAVGDQLWVREAIFPAPLETQQSPPVQTLWNIAYRDGQQLDKRAPATYNPTIYNYERWTPSIHMPRWASRIDLLITGVRVERLQDISEEDAQAEGAPTELSLIGDKHFLGFRTLWKSIYGEETWQENPWVWVIEFQRVEPKETPI